MTRPDYEAVNSVHNSGNVSLWFVRCRVYVERPDKLSLRLYITRIDESDAGLYTCTAAVAPAGSRDSQPSSRQRRMLTLSQQTKLFLYGRSDSDFIFC